MNPCEKTSYQSTSKIYGYASSSVASRNINSSLVFHELPMYQNLSLSKSKDFNKTLNLIININIPRQFPDGKVPLFASSITEN